MFDVFTFLMARKYAKIKFNSISGGFDYKGSVSALTDLPAASAENKGHEYTVGDTGTYVSDGTAWKPVGVKGADGSTVSVSATGTSTNKVNYITVNGTESKFGGVNETDLNTFVETHVYETQDDTARNAWGGGWRMPTFGELEELWALGWTFTEVPDGGAGRPGYETITANGHTIKLPTTATRGGADSDLIMYPTSELASTNNNHTLGKCAYAELWRGHTSHNKYNANFVRWGAMYIRPVLDIGAEANGHTAVDLGLSVLWADRNIGAISETDKGTKYAWGEDTTKDEFTFANYKYAGSVNNTYTKYVTNASNGIVDNLTTLTVNTFIPKADIVDALNSDDSTKVLSAKQGKTLNTNKQDKLTAGTGINISQSNVISVVNGAYKYSGTITGDGEATDFVVTHNLNSQAIVVQIYNNSTHAQIAATVVLTSANTATITFSEAPAQGVVYSVVCIG